METIIENTVFIRHDKSKQTLHQQGISTNTVKKVRKGIKS